MRSHASANIHVTSSIEDARSHGREYVLLTVYLHMSSVVIHEIPRVCIPNYIVTLMSTQPQQPMHSYTHVPHSLICRRTVFRTVG